MHYLLFRPLLVDLSVFANLTKYERIALISFICLTLIFSETNIILVFWVSRFSSMKCLLNSFPVCFVLILLGWFYFLLCGYYHYRYYLLWWWWRWWCLGLNPRLTQARLELYTWTMSPPPPLFLNRGWESWIMPGGTSRTTWFLEFGWSQLNVRQTTPKLLYFLSAQYPLLVHFQYLLRTNSFIHCEQCKYPISTYWSSVKFYHMRLLSCKSFVVFFNDASFPALN